MQHKANVMKLFVGRSHDVVRRLILAVCPNGDWRASDIEYYVLDIGDLALRRREVIVEHLTCG